MGATLDALSAGTVREYARELISAGFTVYAPVMPGRVGGEFWFAYSLGEYFGTFSASSIDGPDHSMPIAPSRLNGSSARIHAPGVDPLSVEYARMVCRASNFCPWNAEPTRDAIAAANTGRAVPPRFYRGATLENRGALDGIGRYLFPVEVAR